MTRVLVAFVACLIGIAAARAAGPTGLSLHDTPRPVPEIAFTDEAGAPLTLGTWRGKLVVLNIWATWCAPCRAEMPTLDRLQARLGSDRFEVLALSIDRAGPGAVRRFYEDIGLEHLRLVIDQSGRIARDLKVVGLPATLLIAPDGRELGRHFGAAVWDTPEMIAFFEGVLGTSR